MQEPRLFNLDEVQAQLTALQPTIKIRRPKSSIDEAHAFSGWTIHKLEVLRVYLDPSKGGGVAVPFPPSPFVLGSKWTRRTSSLWIVQPGKARASSMLLLGRRILMVGCRAPSTAPELRPRLKRHGSCIAACLGLGHRYCHLDGWFEALIPARASLKQPPALCSSTAPLFEEERYVLFQAYVTDFDYPFAFSQRRALRPCSPPTYPPSIPTRSKEGIGPRSGSIDRKRTAAPIFPPPFFF